MVISDIAGLDPVKTFLEPAIRKSLKYSRDAEKGHTVRVAPDGFAALMLAQQKLPDVMLLDIGMPGLNGYEVATRLRKIEGAEDVMLVALTGWGQPADRARASDAGFDHHLTKPIDYEELEALLTKFCNRAPRGKPELRVVNS